MSASPGVKGVVDLEIIDLCLKDIKFPEQISDKKLFSHGFYTITNEYHKQSAILPVSVNLAILRITIIIRIPELRNCKNA